MRKWLDSVTSRRPLLTKVSSGVVLGALADFLAQSFFSSAPLDYERVGRLSVKPWLLEPHNIIRNNVGLERLYPYTYYTRLVQLSRQIDYCIWSCRNNTKNCDRPTCDQPNNSRRFLHSHGCCRRPPIFRWLYFICCLMYFIYCVYTCVHTDLEDYPTSHIFLNKASSGQKNVYHRQCKFGSHKMYMFVCSKKLFTRLKW